MMYSRECENNSDRSYLASTPPPLLGEHKRRQGKPARGAHSDDNDRIGNMPSLVFLTMTKAFHSTNVAIRRVIAQATFVDERTALYFCMNLAPTPMGAT